MQPFEPPTSLFSLKQAIDYRPLTVAPDTLLTEAITIMGKAQSSCVLPTLEVPLDSLLMSEARASSILVVEENHLIGVFTERDAVCLLASGRNLTQAKITEVMTQPAIALTLSDTDDIFTALSLLRQHQIRHLPILDNTGQLVGVVTLESIRQALQLDELLKLQPLAEAITAPVIQAPVTASALSLAKLMAKHQVNCVLLTEEVTGENQESPIVSPVGIVTERDILQLLALKLDLQQTQAQEVMNTSVLCLSSSESVLVALWEMQQRYVQRLVVSENPGELLGIITPTSFLQTLDLTEMSRSLEQLQQSIHQFEVEKSTIPQKGNVALEPKGQESPAELIEQLERNRLLTTIALRIRESLNLEEILKTAVTEVGQFLHTDRTIIYRFNPDLSGTVVVEATASGWQPALNTTVTDSCFAKNYAHHYKKGRIQVTEDIYTAGLTQCHIDILAIFDIRANLVVPILQGEHLWGLLCAYQCSGPRCWRTFEVDLLKQLATQVAIAIQQSELYQQVQTELAERKRVEEQIKSSLKEKEVLLKEIHHRVKNNLQIISSLLKLQSSYSKDDQTLGLFKDSQNRIRSMALIHEKLYQSKDLSNINLAEYIRDLTSNLLRSYNASSQAVNLRTSVNDISLSIDTAIPCGLIINELVSNSLKHAFPAIKENNEIYLDVHSHHDNKFIMVVGDNGIGFPQNLDFQNTDSLGLELVCTLAEQLDGTIELDNTCGTKFTITFAEVAK